MDSYLCPNCQNANNDTATAQLPVGDQNHEELIRLLKILQVGECKVEHLPLVHIFSQAITKFRLYKDNLER